LSIAWSGLADSKYYHYIAKYCLPSWQYLPGDKFIVHDSNDITDHNLKVINWEYAYNRDNTFTKKCKRTKPVNFWRKMQSQIWALKTLREYDWVILLDTDVEVLNFNQTEFTKILNGIKESKLFWATGESQKKRLDAGHIVVNMRDPRLNQFIFDYEYIWESGRIFELDRYYDGQAVESLFNVYPSYKIPNTDHGGGLHTYELGTVHYGSKIPKLLRALYNKTTNFMVDEIIKQKSKMQENKETVEDLIRQINEKSIN
jgi:hypothetical protein